MLNIQSISKTFNPGTVNAKQALSGLSLHLDHGDFVTIIGSNGAGKTTTMQSSMRLPAASTSMTALSSWMARTSPICRSTSAA